MRTTLDIDDTILEETLQSTGASSKKKAVEIALREYIRTKQRQDLISRIGTWNDFDLTLEDLEKLRNESYRHFVLAAQHLKDLHIMAMAPL